jgi:hypothetical protein
VARSAFGFEGAFRSTGLAGAAEAAYGDFLGEALRFLSGLRPLPLNMT